MAILHVQCPLVLSVQLCSYSQDIGYPPGRRESWGKSYDDPTNRGQPRDESPSSLPLYLYISLLAQKYMSFQNKTKEKDKVKGSD